MAATVLGVVGLLWLSQLRLSSSSQAPVEFLNSDGAWQEYLTAIKPWNSLFAAGSWGIENLTDNEQEIRYVELGNEASSTEKIGIELRSLGFDVRVTKDDSWLRVSAVPNTTQRIVARIAAEGTAYDAATSGATASCLTFELPPHQLAKVPILLAAKDIHGLTDNTYAVLVKTGDDVACQTIIESNQTSWTGFLTPDKGTGVKLEGLRISGGRIQ